MEHGIDFSNWEQTKLKLQEKYPELTSEDLLYEAGKEADVLLRIEKRLGKNREEIKNFLSLMG